MVEITTEEIGYMKKILECYYFAQDQQQKELHSALELQMLLEQECKVSGMSYDSYGNGCSVSFPEGSYLQQLSIEIATHDVEAKRWMQKFKGLDKTHKINYRLNRLPKDQKETLLNVYRRGISVYKLAEKAEISTQAYHDRINTAIRHMLKVE
ncbi:hypothetical protein MKC80_20555 [[Clostridium] innocuum]|jgi:hypothetical protein|nr:hypothetical protein [[Clostridium] innocuum]